MLRAVLDPRVEREVIPNPEAEEISAAAVKRENFIVDNIIVYW